MSSKCRSLDYLVVVLRSRGLFLRLSCQLTGLWRSHRNARIERTNFKDCWTYDGDGQLRVSCYSPPQFLLRPQFLLKFVGPYGTISDSSFENHPLASEILINFRGQSASSHRIEVVYAVISAVSACHQHIYTSEARLHRTNFCIHGGDISCSACSRKERPLLFPH